MATAAPKTATVKFTRERETPGTVVFKEVHPITEPKQIGTLYVQKHVAQGAEFVTVTLEFGQ